MIFLIFSQLLNHHIILEVFNKRQQKQRQIAAIFVYAM